MVTIYLDACCLNRPFDDQTQDRIRLESEAMVIILGHIGAGRWTWITSDALSAEIRQTPHEERRRRVLVMMESASQRVAARAAEQARAAQLVGMGFHAFDALHIACAESGGADILLSTDDQLVQRADRFALRLAVRVANPLVWLKEVTAQ